jgi:hypothetical protein
MTDQEPPVDSLEALKHIRVLLQVAADSEHIDQIEKHLAKAQAIIDKSLPRKRTPSS